jgi:hypothetical protein
VCVELRNRSVCYPIHLRLSCECKLLINTSKYYYSSTKTVCFWRDSPPVDQGLLIHKVSRSHTTTHHSRYDSPGRMISPLQRPLSNNTQHSQQTDIHAPGGIQTHNLSKRAASDLRLRLRGQWDRLVQNLCNLTVAIV